MSKEFEDLKPEVEEQSKKTKKNKHLDKIQELEEQILALKEENLRVKADSENFKKRLNDEKVRDRKYAASTLIHDLLIPLDQLKKVVEFEQENKELNNYLIGFKMINNSIYQVLEEDGLKEIKALGEKFDPNYHYAVEKENNKEIEDGIITEVITTGYMYKDRLLRAALVKVNEWSEENENNK